jgi:hypothetical protein
MNVLHWENREEIRFEQLEWSNVTTYRVKFSGKFNKDEIRRALERKTNKVEDVHQESDDSVIIKVENLIGD